MQNNFTINNFAVYYIVNLTLFKEDSMAAKDKEKKEPKKKPQKTLMEKRKEKQEKKKNAAQS